MDKHLLERRLFDSSDKRYRRLYRHVLIDWTLPVDIEKLAGSYMRFKHARNRRRIHRAALAINDPHVVQTALLESITTFEECLRLLWIFNKSTEPTDYARSLNPEAFARIIEQMKKNKSDPILLDLLGILLGRSFEMTVWLLPLSGLNKEGLNPLYVAAACKRILDPDADVEEREAAEEIRDFIWALETLIQSRLIVVELQDDKNLQASLDATKAKQPEDNAPLSACNVFRKVDTDDFWEVRFGNGTLSRIKNLLGLRYIAELIRRSPLAISAPDLSSLLSKSAPIQGRQEFNKASNAELGKIGMRSSGKADQAVQDQTHDELKEQLRDVLEALDKANREGNTVEIDWLEKEKAELLSNMRTPMTWLTSPQDNNARNAVSKSIQKAYDAIQEKNRPLYLHLDDAIHMGFELSYRPKVPTTWLQE